LERRTHNWGTYKYNEGAYAEFQVGQAGWFEDMIKSAGNVYTLRENTQPRNQEE